jgi:hypothetical protein
LKENPILKELYGMMEGVALSILKIGMALNPLPPSVKED